MAKHPIKFTSRRRIIESWALLSLNKSNTFFLLL